MDFKVNDFEGPLSLLYQQLKKNKMDIYTVDISKLTDQFLNAFRKIEMSMDETSEFILLAAELIGIKTKLLLSNPKEDTENPVEELAFRLEIYETFLNISNILKSMQNSEKFYKKAEIMDIDKKLKIDVTTDFLKNTFLDLLKRQIKIEDEIPIINMEKEIYSVEDKIIYIESLVLGNDKINFTDIFKSIKNIKEKIVVFLALLELITKRKIKVYQDGNFKEIFIKHE
ncbi:MAG: segregation/condensation protein A [Defluviitaleaceae bacterium]|nr:segregation/condensation protein A [Defluviitaleaceae bacterium]